MDPLGHSFGLHMPMVMHVNQFESTIFPELIL